MSEEELVAFVDAAHQKAVELKLKLQEIENDLTLRLLRAERYKLENIKLQIELKEAHYIK